MRYAVPPGFIGYFNRLVVAGATGRHVQAPTPFSVEMGFPQTVTVKRPTKHANILHHCHDQGPKRTHARQQSGVCTVVPGATGSFNAKLDESQQSGAPLRFCTIGKPIIRDTTSAGEDISGVDVAHVSRGSSVSQLCRWPNGLTR